jgi:ATP-dependent Lhr-like helicase
MQTSEANLTEAWVERQGWVPLPFQREVWNLMAAGASGLVHSSTGTGKTYAVWLGFLQNFRPTKGLKVLWITPLRALAEDTTLALNRPLEDVGIDWRVELRTGDSTASAKQSQLKKPPGGLVSTPESVCLLLARKDAEFFFSGIQLVVVDEWHELMGSKRGTQVELALARLRKWNPSIQVWGLSATLANMEEAAEVLRVSSLVRGAQDKEIVVKSLLPQDLQRFPWAGHLGEQMMPRVAEQIQDCRSALIFTNMRSQAEAWYQNLLMLLPEMKDEIGLHHGSIDRATRESVEDGLRTGRLRAVVCTSTLDLGVDFSPVERVFQIGSPKGVARLMQRAGRSGHRPGEASEVTIVPTHALELIDIAALRDAVREKRVEARIPPFLPLDVLVQHLVTIALGGGFRANELLAEVRKTHAFRNLIDEDWQWCLDFVTKGGKSLAAYDDYHRVSESDGCYTVENRRIAMRHLMGIGTIVSDSSVRVAFLKGPTLGTIEESFVSRLKKGDRFIFAGKSLEFVMLKDLTCYVRRVTSSKARIVRWMGARMSLSTQLADEIRIKLDQAHHGELSGPEMEFSAELLTLQNRWSALPDRDQLLIESLKTREGYHVFFYPIEGRLVHEGLAALFAYRFARLKPMTFTLSSNDYGFELLSDQEIPFTEAVENELFTTENLMADIAGSVNATELARRQFREIARVAGLVFQNKQVQASSGLIFDVFARYEPDNKLLEQATREVMERQLEESRFVASLHRMQRARLVMTNPKKPTPFGFPLMVNRFRETLSSEEVEDRIRKMIETLDKAANEL